MSATAIPGGNGAFEGAILAAAKLCAAMSGINGKLIESRRREALAAFERLAESGIDSPWLRWRISYLHDDLMWRACWAMEGVELFQRLGELLSLDEAVTVAPSSRPATPPPASGRGDELKLEPAAASDARDTEPPSDPLWPDDGRDDRSQPGGMACCGTETWDPSAWTR